MPILEQLRKTAAIELTGIGTQQDRPAGRKRALTPTPVGCYAAEHGIDIDKPASVNDEEFVAYLEKLSPDIIIVVSYGQLLKARILSLPKFCCLNVHASILPLYRGASPIAAAILNRDDSTGVSFMAMDKGLDTGGVYHIAEMKLKGCEYADTLELELGRLAAECIEKVVVDIASGKLLPEPQDDAKSSITRKIKKNDGLIDWTQSAIDIEAMVRGYYPWPGAVFDINLPNRSLRLTLTRAEVLDDLTGKPGEVLQADKHDWIVACGEQALKICSVVPQGKKEMGGTAFLNGCRLEPGLILV